MPFLHEFGPDDIFQNNLETSPGKKFTAYSGSLYVNESRYKGVNIGTGSISLYELNVDRTTSPDDTNTVHAFIIKTDLICLSRALPLEHTAKQNMEQSSQGHIR